MPDQTPKSENIPSYEEIEKEWGLDMMSFFHDMVSPDDPQERGDEDRA